MAEINDPILVEIGTKLANFRRKLANSIGEKKIKQIVFGEMYGGYSKRKIETYEGGTSEIPAKLFFILWRNGNSIDALFSEGNISDAGREQARLLFGQSITARLEHMDESETERVRAAMEDVKHDKTRQAAPIKEGSIRTFGKRKRSNSAAGKTKKR